MARPLGLLTLTALLIAGTPATATADWHLTPFLGFTFQGQTTLLDYERAVGKADWSFGVAGGFLGDGPLGAEGLLVYTPGFFQQDNPPADSPDVISSHTLAVMGNVVLTTPRRWTEYGLRPYLSGGIGLLRAAFDDEFGVTPVRSNQLGYNIGGGAVGFLTDRAGLRFDLRYFSNLKPTDSDEAIALGRVQLNYWNATVGVVFRY